MKAKDGLTSKSTKRTVKVVEFRDEPINVDDPEPQTQTLEKMVDDIAKKLQNSEDEIIAINVMYIKKLLHHNITAYPCPYNLCGCYASLLTTEFTSWVRLHLLPLIIARGKYAVVQDVCRDLNGG